MSYRVLLTASRSWTDFHSIWSLLDLIHAEHPDMVLRHGAARGGDWIAEMWAHARRVTSSSYPARWDRYGRAAGIIRNGEMVQAGADECLAFIRDRSRGATDCADKAEAAGIPTTRILWSDLYAL